MNLNRGQWLSIVIAVLGVWVASTTQLNDLVGPALTKVIIAGSTLTMSTLAAINTIVQGQGSQLSAVQAMPGVEKILVNSQANGTLATMTVDPAQTKMEAMPGSQSDIEATARADA